MPDYLDDVAPAFAMTDGQRFFFDLRGWLLLPAVLSHDELHEMRAECYAHADPLEVRPGFGSVKDGYAGGLQILLDHAAIVGILSEILTDQPSDDAAAYRFRCESSHVIVRPPRWSRATDARTASLT